MLEEQMERVTMLNEMVLDLIDRKLNHVRYWSEWNEVYRDKGCYLAGVPPIEPTNAEIKRIMLVLRQETLKLDKLL